MRGGLTRCVAILCAVVLLMSVSGVWATWKYAELPPEHRAEDLLVRVNPTLYAPELPVGDALLLQRIQDILCNNYTNDSIPDGHSMDYLLSTLDKNWDIGSSPLLGSFVGSMDSDPESKARINAMFGDVIDMNHVSFILKSEDLVGSVDDEIALYSTSDPLRWNSGYWTPMVVGVYLSVFVPIIDEQGVTVGYEMLCNSLHGYCMEVAYMESDPTPSFSTDHWRDELFYWNEYYPDPQPITGDDRYNYECYHPADGNYAYPGRSASWLGWINVQSNQWAVGDFMGKKARQRLEEILASRTME